MLQGYLNFNAYLFFHLDFKYYSLHSPSGNLSIFILKHFEYNLLGSNILYSGTFQNVNVPLGKAYFNKQWIGYSNIFIYKEIAQWTIIIQELRYILEKWVQLNFLN